MGRRHINLDNVEGPCNANPDKPNGRPCPYPRHFDSSEAAQTYLADQAAIAHGHQPPPPVNRTLAKWRRDALAATTIQDPMPPAPPISPEDRLALSDAVRRAHMHTDDPDRKATLKELASRLEDPTIPDTDKTAVTLVAIGIAQDEHARLEPSYFDQSTRVTLAARAHIDDLNSPDRPIPGLYGVYQSKDAPMVGPNEACGIEAAYAGVTMPAPPQNTSLIDAANQISIKAQDEYETGPMSHYRPGQPIGRGLWVNVNKDRHARELYLRNWAQRAADEAPHDQPSQDFNNTLKAIPPGTLSGPEIQHAQRALNYSADLTRPPHHQDGWRENMAKRPTRAQYAEMINTTYGTQPVNGFVVIDTETSDLHARNGDVLEYGLVYMDTTGKILGRRSFVQRPTGPDNYVGLSGLHRITPEIAAKGADQTEGGRALQSMLDGWVPVAHNADFDRSHVNEHLDRAGLDRTKGNWVDTMVLFGHTGAPKTNLKHMVRKYNVPLGDAHHSALYDAAATAKCLQQMLPDTGIHLQQAPNPTIPDSPFPDATVTRGDDPAKMDTFWNNLFT